MLAGRPVGPQVRNQRVSMRSITSVEVTQAALDEASRALATQGPVHMVNLLRYRAEAAYEPEAPFPPCSGREAYLARYAPEFARAAAQVAPGEPFSVTLLSHVHATLVAPAGETWDDIVIVEYPSFATLRRILGSPEYAAGAAPHRRAALADWRFLATAKVVRPGAPT